MISGANEEELELANARADILLLQQENEELKKQLEKKYSKIGTLTNEVLYEENTKLINQQQEFIKYLQDCIKELEKENLNKLQNVLNLGISDITKEVLKKYKEIIGV